VTGFIGKGRQNQAKAFQERQLKYQAEAMKSPGNKHTGKTTEDLTAMMIRRTLGSRQQAAGSRQDNCALFASCGRRTHGTEYRIRDG
jgi:hypothetical protein